MDDNIITEYFHLKETIQSKYNKLDNVVSDFKQRSKHTRIVPDELKLRTYGFNVEREVINHVDRLYLRNDRIRKLEQKLKYFNQYLATLSPSELEALYSHYKHGEDVSVSKDLEQRTKAEIREIEEAIGYMFNDSEEPPALVVHTGDTKDEFNQILNVLGV